jgi:hypothetical protein
MGTDTISRSCPCLSVTSVQSVVLSEHFSETVRPPNVYLTEFQIMENSSGQNRVIVAKYAKEVNGGSRLIWNAADVVISEGGNNGGG